MSQELGKRRTCFAIKLSCVPKHSITGDVRGHGNACKRRLIDGGLHWGTGKGRNGKRVVKKLQTRKVLETSDDQSMNPDKLLLRSSRKESETRY